MPLIPGHTKSLVRFFLGHRSDVLLIDDERVIGRAVIKVRYQMGWNAPIHVRVPS